MPHNGLSIQFTLMSNQSGNALAVRRVESSTNVVISFTNLGYHLYIVDSGKNSTVHDKRLGSIFTTCQYIGLVYGTSLVLAAQKASPTSGI